MAETVSEKLGLRNATEVARWTHNATRYDGTKAGARLIEVDRAAVVEAVARWLEAECASPKRAADIRRELLSEGEG